MDWGELYAHLSVCLGWTWDKIDEMTLIQLKSFNDYWAIHPPVHIMVAAYMGLSTTKSKSVSTQEPSAASLEAFIAEANLIEGCIIEPGVFTSNNQ